MLTHIVGQIAGCVGVADLGARRYRLDFVDGKSREATAEEVHAAAAAHVREAIKADRDRRKGTGCPVGQYVFHSDDPSRIQQLGLVILGANLPPGIMWKTVSGEFVEMTPTMAQQIFAAQAARDIALFSAAEAHIAAAAAAVDPLTYDFSAGWPE